MKTDELIDALSDRLEPTTPMAPLRTLALWTLGGAALSLVLMVLWRGLRPDLMIAMGGMMFWVKFGYTLAIGALAFWAAERLGRPGAEARTVWWRLEGLVALFVLIALIKLVATPADARPKALMGHSAFVCPWCILALTAPILVGALVGMRRFAPTRPGLTGLAAGLAAGGFGAFVYAFSCNESAMPFVAVWYTLPVLVAGAVGALAGRFVLRW